MLLASFQKISYSIHAVGFCAIVVWVWLRVGGTEELCSQCENHTDKEPGRKGNVVRK